MSRLSITAMVLFSLLLSGCNSPYVAAGISRAVGQVGPQAAQPQIDAPKISVTLLSSKIRFPMALLDQDGGNTIWAASDGAQIFLRNGVLVGTRGLGQDLMSAQVPSPTALLAHAVHDRSYFDMDGSDTMIRHDFICRSEKPKSGIDLPGTKQIAEVCEGTFGKITNHYWIDRSLNVRKSAQWVSESVGYVVVEPFIAPK